MTNNDFDSFVELWEAMRSSYDHAKQISAHAIAIEFEALKPLGELKDIQRALSAHKRNSQDGMFVPTAAHLVKYLKGDAESRALMAWTNVDWAIDHLSRYESVVFDHPATMAAVVDMGGWLELCSKVNEKEKPFKKQEFVKRFNGYMIQPPREWPTHLKGLTELTNEEKFPDWVPDPKLVGDVQKCIEVNRTGIQNSQKTITLKQAHNELSNQLSKLNQATTRSNGD